MQRFRLEKMRFRTLMICQYLVIEGTPSTIIQLAFPRLVTVEIIDSF
jgi:hypothetical protein